MTEAVIHPLKYAWAGSVGSAPLELAIRGEEVAASSSRTPRPTGTVRFITQLAV